MSIYKHSGRSPEHKRLFLVDYWKTFCGREKMDAETKDKGLMILNSDPEYWYQRSMWELYGTIHGEI